MIQIAAILSLAATPARVVHVDGLLALNIQGHVYSLGGDLPLHIGADIIQSSVQDRRQEIQLLRGGKKIAVVDLTGIAEKWLDADEPWGGHENANQTRYLVRRYGGVLRADLTECIPNADGSALGVLSLRVSDDWHKQTAGQVLIRIERNPFKIAEFRFLGSVATPDTPAPMSDVPRLYKFGNREFVVDGPSVREVDSSGKELRTLCSLPTGAAPVGMSGGRWIISQQYSPSGLQRWLATDLKTGTSRSVLGIPNKPAPYDVENIEGGKIDPRSEYILFERRIFDPDHTEYFTVHVPDGKQTMVAKPVFRVVGPYAMYMYGEKVWLYSAKTGREVQQLTMPHR